MVATAIVEIDYVIQRRSLAVAKVRSGTGDLAKRLLRQSPTRIVCWQKFPSRWPLESSLKGPLTLKSPSAAGWVADKGVVGGATGLG
jgi:hypothetical protein